MCLGLDPPGLPFIKYCINKNDAQYVQVIYVSKIIGKYPIRDCGHSNIIITNPQEIVKFIGHPNEYQQSIHMVAYAFGVISLSKRIYSVANQKEDESEQGYWKRGNSYGTREGECIVGIYIQKKNHGTFRIRLEQIYFKNLFEIGHKISS